MIKAEADSGIFALNGAAARKAEVGDQLFILAYAQIDPNELLLKPKIIHLEEN